MNRNAHTHTQRRWSSIAEGAGGGKGRALIEPPIEQSHLATTVAFYVHNLYISFDISLLIYVCLYVCLSACMCDCVCACVRVCVYIKQHSGSVCLFIVASVAVVVRNRNSICSSMFPFGLVWFGFALPFDDDAWGCDIYRM